MKLDKTGKNWAKVVAFTMWSIFLHLLGGAFSPWVDSATITTKVIGVLIMAILTLFFACLYWFTEEK